MRELELLEDICRGIDPTTGEVFDTPRDPALDRARLAYLTKLRSIAKKRKHHGHSEADIGNPVSNHGKSWSKADNEKLIEEWNSALAPNAAFLAKKFSRSKGAILARLVHLGVYETREEARAADISRR